MLKLYANCTPNKGGDIHYFPHGRPTKSAFFADFLAKIADKQFGADLNYNSYTIYNNVLRISLPASNAVQDYTDVTYVTTDSPFMAWHVIGYTYYGDAVEYRLAPDLWIMGIYNVEYETFNLKATNRITTKKGFYRDVAYAEKIDDTIESLDFSDLRVVFWVNCEISHVTWFNNIPSSEIKVLCAPLITKDLHDGTPLTFVVEYTLQILKNIVTIKIGNVNNNCTVMSAAIVPANAVNTTVFTWHFNSFDQFGNEVTWDVTDMLIGVKTLNYSYTQDFDPNYVYTFGGLLNQYTLVRSTGMMDFDVTFAYTVDGLTVQLRQDEKTYDLTSEYTFGVNRTNGGMSTFERISGALSMLSGIASGVFQIKSGGAGIVSGALSLSNTVTSQFKSQLSSIAGDGNGLINFFYVPESLDNVAYNGVKIRKYKSVVSETDIADKYGLIFDVLLNGPSDVISANPIIANSITPCYIVANVNIHGVNDESETFIAAEFERGIYCEYANANS